MSDALAIVVLAVIQVLAIMASVSLWSKVMYTGSRSAAEIRQAKRRSAAFMVAVVVLTSAGLEIYVLSR